MIFSHISRVMAVVGLIASAMSFLSAYHAYFDLLDKAVGRSEGDRNFDLGLKILLFSIALGTLAEISFSLRKKADE